MLLGQVMLNVCGTTMMLKLQLVELPQESWATQLTTVLPIGKVLPLGGTQLIVKGGQVPLTSGA